MSDEEKCSSCRFWQGHGRHDGLKSGDCRRYPPVLPPLKKHISSIGRGGVYSGMVPETFADEWCGEFQRKEA